MITNKIIEEMKIRTSADEVRVWDYDLQSEVMQAIESLNKENSKFLFQPYELNGWIGILKLLK